MWDARHAALFSGYQNAKASTLRVPHVVDRMEKAVVANAKKGGAQARGVRESVCVCVTVCVCFFSTVLRWLRW